MTHRLRRPPRTPPSSLGSSPGARAGSFGWASTSPSGPRPRRPSSARPSGSGALRLAPPRHPAGDLPGPAGLDHRAADLLGSSRCDEQPPQRLCRPVSTARGYCRRRKFRIEVPGGGEKSWSPPVSPRRSPPVASLHSPMRPDRQQGESGRGSRASEDNPATAVTRPDPTRRRSPTRADLQTLASGPPHETCHNVPRTAPQEGLAASVTACCPITSPLRVELSQTD